MAWMAVETANRELKRMDIKYPRVKDLAEMLRVIDRPPDLAKEAGSGPINKMIQRSRGAQMPRPEYENFAVLRTQQFPRVHPVAPNCELWAELISRYQLRETTGMDKYKQTISRICEGALQSPLGLAPD